MIGALHHANFTGASLVRTGATLVCLGTIPHQSASLAPVVVDDRQLAGRVERTWSRMLTARAGQCARARGSSFDRLRTSDGWKRQTRETRHSRERVPRAPVSFRGGEPIARRSQSPDRRGYILRRDGGWLMP